MKNRFTLLLYFFSVAGLLLCLPYLAHAKALPFKEIIKAAQDTAVVSSIVLDSKTHASLPTKFTTTSSFAAEPLFLQKPTLQPLSQVVVSSAYNPESVYNWATTLPQLTETDTENARFELAEGRVTDFSPGKNGVKIDFRKTTLALLESLKASAQESPVTSYTVQPENALADTNTLGITEFIAGGVSDFTGSSNNRLANIEAGIRQMRGLLIKPGETFSFGEHLGDITAEKGFKPEIVIKADGLKPELGGGICQVSSTLYRAVMQSGMPITQRKNHAFSVSHYLPAGTDATIYTPVTDLKFTNDTAAHILIWPYYKGKTGLVFDLYGTSDGRSVVVDEPIQWDRQSNGALKASWTRHVTKNGVTRDDVFKSNYLPPALFKKEEVFVTAQPSPITPSPAPTETAPVVPTT